MTQNSFCTKCHRIPSQCVCGGTFRELTDEEIYDCFKIPKDKRNTGQSDYNLIGCREVADAILRKASEK